MKLGILGAGMIVREFLPWLTGPESPFKVEALCSTERSAGAAQALCDQYGVPRHTTSYDELLSWVDVVYIAVPNILHVKYTRAALEAGRHVIIEAHGAEHAAEDSACGGTHGDGTHGDRQGQKAHVKRAYRDTAQADGLHDQLNGDQQCQPGEGANVILFHNLVFLLAAVPP